MRKSVVIILIVGVAVIFTLLSLRRAAKLAAAKEQIEAAATSNNAADQAQALQPKSSGQNQNQEIAVQTNQEAQAGKTPREIIAEKNLNPQDFYGKVVDQYGRPIPDVDVSGVLITETGDGFNSKPYSSKTDLNGLFEFTGMRGAGFNINIKKNGYYMSERGGGYQAPPGGKSTQDNRVLLTMWKIQGAATLVGSSINTKISCDGSSITFDRTTGKESPNGDLRITLSRFPLQLKPGLVHPYDWQFKMEIVGGGMIEESDPYPYIAPDSGYLPFFEFQISSNAVPWKSQLERSFYVKTAQGQFGKMHMTLYSAQKTPTLQISLTMNPSGSQNLEPAFSR